MNLTEQVRIDVQRALEEDVGDGDLTASLVPPQARATATIICREAAVICGRPWVEEVLRRVAPTAQACIVGAAAGTRDSNHHLPRGGRYLWASVGRRGVAAGGSYSPS